MRPKGQSQLCGGGRAPASWISAGMWLLREKGSTQGRGVKRKGPRLGGTGKEGPAQAADPERRRLSLQTSEDLRSCSGCQSSHLRSNSSELYFAPQVSTPPQPQGQRSGQGAIRGLVPPEERHTKARRAVPCPGHTGSPSHRQGGKPGLLTPSQCSERRTDSCSFTGEETEARSREWLSSNT